VSELWFIDFGGDCMARREFEFQDEKSHKFWTIDLEGSGHTVHYGRFGAQGQKNTKTFDSPEMARKSYDRLIGQKLKKGYVEVEGSGDPAQSAQSPEPKKKPETEEASTPKRDRPAVDLAAGGDTRRFELAEGKSIRHWTIELEGLQHVETEVHTETFASEEAARKSFLKLLERKVKQNYSPVDWEALRLVKPDEQAGKVSIPVLDWARFPTIGEALERAEPGMEVYVYPGVYRERVVVDKDIKIVGQEDRHLTIVEAPEGPTFEVTAGSAEIRGLTIRGSGPSREVGAVSITDGSVLFEECDLSSRNRPAVTVSGTRATPTFRSCRVHDSDRHGILFREGGGGLVEDCDLEWMQGGAAGIFIERGCSPVIRASRFRGSPAGVRGDGGLIEDCEFSGNRDQVRVENAVLRNCNLIGDSSLYGKAVLEDCTIRRGRISCGGRPTLRRCQFLGGEKTYLAGSGYLCEDSEFRDSEEAGASTSGKAILRRCKFISNKTGIVADRDANLYVEDCQVSRSELQALSVVGGKAYLWGCELRDSGAAGVRAEKIQNATARVVLDNCVIRDNGGHGLETEEASFRLRNCLVADNSKFGLYGVGTAIDCTVTGNQLGTWKDRVEPVDCVETHRDQPLLDQSQKRLFVLEFLDGIASGRTDFAGANLEDLSLEEVYGVPAPELQSLNLTGASLQGAYLEKRNLSLCNLSRANLRHASVTYSTMDRVDLSDADFSHGTVDYTGLNGANFRGACLTKACIGHFGGRNPEEDAPLDFTGARGAGVKLNGHFREAIFVDFDALGASISGLLKGADFSRAKLQDAKFNQNTFVEGGNQFQEARFRDADLRNADFTKCKLNRADFSGADLRGANFTGADLTEANLESAKLGDNKWENAILDGTRLPEEAASTKTEFESKQKEEEAARLAKAEKKAAEPPRKRLPEAPEPLKTLAAEISTFTLVRSAGGEDLVTFQWSKKEEFSLASLLFETGFIQPIEEATFLEALTEYGADQELVDAWKSPLAALAKRCSDMEWLDVRNFCGSGSDDWDDQVYILVGRESVDGPWWAVGPELEAPESVGGYGSELPLPTVQPPPEWLGPLTELRILLTHGQEEVLTGECTSSGSAPTTGPLLVVSGESRDAAVELYLRKSNFLAAHPFNGFLGDDDDYVEPGSQYAEERPAIKKLDHFLLELDDVRLYVLGTWANYNHFVVGQYQDGTWVGLIALAAWA
jgi:uncharacterized protein YjbI with pentapeptide repeats/predicted DNA-binding WGR domain protein